MPRRNGRLRAMSNSAMVISRHSAVAGIRVFIHDARVVPRKTMQLSRNGTARSAPAPSRCRETVQLAVTCVSYGESALLTASGTPLRPLIPKGVGMYDHLRPGMPVTAPSVCTRCRTTDLDPQQESVSGKPGE